FWTALAPDASPERSAPGDLRDMKWACGRAEEIHLRDSKGRARVVEWRWRVLRDERGQPRHRLGIGIDVSERRRDQDWLAKQQQQRVEADKMMALGTFISGLAHEIGNPNQVIQINLPLLQESWGQLRPKLPAALEGSLCGEVAEMLHEVCAASD